MWTPITDLRAGWRVHHENPDAGYASEAVLVTALLIIAALVVIGIVVAKVTSRAQDIDLSIDLGVLTTVVL